MYDCPDSPLAIYRRRLARIDEAGIFAEDDRVELIDGEVRAMSPIGPRHAAIVKRLNALMSRQIADRAISASKTPFS